MQPLPASPARGGSTPTPSPSNENETGDSTFTDSATDQVRESDNNTSVNVKNTLPLLPSADAAAPVDLMSSAESLPLPNGGGDGDSSRASLPSFASNRQEVFYSNEDITLLHEIVAAGEAILISLPDRERLPTAALFSAADEVLPRHGFALEDVPHVSKLLFQIGGTRGQGSLLDKFRIVLSGMGIELVYTDDELETGNEANDAGGTTTSSVGDVETSDVVPARRLSAEPRDPRDDSTIPNLPPAVLAREVHSSPSPMHYAPGRRRNSDSIALAFGTSLDQMPDGTRDPVARMTRSQSNTGRQPSDPLRKEVRFSDIVDSQSVSDISWDHESTGAAAFDNIPFRPKNNANGAQINGVNGVAHTNQREEEEDARPTTSAENRPPPDFSHFGEQAQGFRSHFPSANGTVLSEDEFSSLSVDVPELAIDQNIEEPSLPQHSGQANRDHGAGASESTDDNHDLPHTEYSTQLPFRDAKDEEDMNKGQIAFIASREQMFKMSSFNHWRDVARHQKAHNIRLESHAETWDAWETVGETLGVWIENALTMQIDENDAVRIYQEHLMLQAQERERASDGSELENLPPTPAVLKKGNINPRIRQSIERSRESVLSAPRSASSIRSADVLSRASQSVDRTLIDDDTPRPAPSRSSGDSQGQRLQAFGRNWQHGREADVENEDEDFYDASEELEIDEPVHDEVIMRSKYQLAAAGWDFFLLSKSMTHWANRAEEEVERTQIARRHILRRRCFGAWLGEREKDETEAESKAIWFSQMVAMRDWRDIAVNTASNTRGLTQAAVRIDNTELADNTISEWYEEAKLRQAAGLDSRQLRTGCLQHWQAASTWLHSAHEEAEGVYSGSLMGRHMRHWREGALIQERAEAGAGPIIARRDEFLRSGLSLAWRQEAEEARTREKKAVDQDLGEFTKHWMYETRLVQWQEEQDYESFYDITYHWYCEWRLVLCQRVIDQQEKARFFEKWTGVAAAQSARSYHLRYLARDVRHHDTITGFFNSGLESLERLELQAYHARGLIVQRVVPKVIKNWTSQFVQYQRLDTWAHLAQQFSAGERVLPHWQAVRKQEWKRRMHRLYLDFRTRMRLDTCTEVFDAWRRDAADNATKGWEADEMHAEEDNTMVQSVTDAWQIKLQYLVFSNEVAEDNDCETHLIQWNSLLEVHGDSRLDAEELDFGQTAAGCWREWDLASLNLRRLDHTAQDVQAKSARSDQRRLVAQWAAHTPNVDNVPELDFRASRRAGGGRWTTPAPQRTRLTTDYTPFRTPARPNFRLSAHTPAYRPPSEMTFEEDEGDGIGIGIGIGIGG